jgi:hypothetical protein
MPLRKAAKVTPDGLQMIFKWQVGNVGNILWAFLEVPGGVNEGGKKGSIFSYSPWKFWVDS